MSDYLPPHTTGGEASELAKMDYSLKKSDITGGSDEIKEYWLHLPADAVPTTQTLITLGPDRENPILKFQPIGFGLWGWGDVITYGWGPSGGYDQKLNEDSIRGAWEEIQTKCNSTLLDTAEHYGYTDGFSEKKLGDFWCEEQDKPDPPGRSSITVATKYLPTPWRHPWRYPKIVKKCFVGSLNRLRVRHIDIYQLHGPSHFGFWPTMDTLCESLAQVYEMGRCKAIGTCNLSFEQVKYVWSYMRKRGIPLVSNQVEFSLVRQDPWSTGLIEKSRKLGVATIAYSPLAVGRLTGKYNQKNKPRGNRNFGDVHWDKILPIVRELQTIGKKHGKTPSAVALNWVICKGAIPIPTAKNKEQANDCLQALGWRLSQEEEDLLDVVGLTNSPDFNLLKHFQNWWWEQG